MKLDPGIFSLLRSSLGKDISTKLKFRHKKYLSSEMIPLWQLSSNKSIKHVVSKKLLSKAYSSALFSRLLLEVFRSTDWMVNVAIFWNIMPLDQAPSTSFIES